MEPTCSVCEEALTNTPTTQLGCGHFYHTQCFLTNLAVAEDLHDMECVVCHQGLFPDIEGEVEEDNNTHGTPQSAQIAETRISNLFDTNEAFRKDIQKYKHAVRGISKPKAAFKKLAAAKKAELTPIWTQIKHQYEGLYHTKKDELTQSQEYKAYKTADARVSRLWTNLRAKYNVNAWSLRGLRTKPGYKRLYRYNSWRDSPPRVIRRALRLRLPWW